MTAPQWQRVRELFDSACEMGAAERDAYLSEACADDAELRVEVESILAESDRSPTFLDGSAADAFPELLDHAGPQSMKGRRVGAYELLRPIAAGGMGAVFLAQRADRQYEKKVAIKLIKRHLATPETIVRFRMERQTLAGLEHPNIAGLQDGGVTDDGLPYLVMEFVDGVSIDRYCDDRRLSVVERLELFRTVCSAVLFAHQNLIVHRDLKPSNILVTADGVPKLLDFGIAKVLDPTRPTAATQVTAGRIMTPEYASPEQIRGEPITTATDVYSLGVVLYELLTGCRPYSIKSRIPHEIERAICEEEPAKPSTVAITSGAGPPKTTPGRPLAADLDSIVLKAMRKEPDRRYASIEQFSEDIRRHLVGLPVIARKDTFSYRAAKFIRRNKVPVTAAGVVLLSLIAGMVATSWQSRVAIRANAVAQKQTRKAERVNTFLNSMLASAQPSEKGKDVTVREILDNAAREIDTGLGDEPEVEAEVHMTLGATYRELGHYAESERHFEAAFTIRRRIFGQKHPSVAETLNAQGMLARAAGRYDDAERLYRRSLVMRVELFGEHDAAVAETMNNLGVLLKRKGLLDEAASYYRRALTIRRTLFGDRHRDVATSMCNLAAVLKNQSRYDDAMGLYRDALSIFRDVLGPEHYRVAVCQNNLALLLQETGDYAGAETLLREALAIRREVFGDEVVGVSTGLKNLALTLMAMGKVSEAESLLREALVLDRKLRDAEHPSLANTLNSLADLLASRGEYDEAEVLCAEGLAIRRKRLSGDHPRVAGSLAVMGRIHLGRGDAAGAELLFRESVTIYRKKLHEDHPKLAVARINWGTCLVALGRYGEAEKEMLGGLRAIVDAWGARHPSARSALQDVVHLYELWGKAEEASRYRDRLLGDKSED
ncbi:MAG: serine/threonine protein kinase [Planctomycetes bacterium]|nr:serine/threonine protein kinase [Planctomycetota bacterium]